MTATMTTPAALAFVDVKRAPFLAKGDNSTDDTTAINSAFTAALVAGGDVYFEQATYAVTNLRIDCTTLARQSDSGAPYGYRVPSLRGSRRGAILSQIAGTSGPMLYITGQQNANAGPGNNNKATGWAVENVEFVGTTGPVSSTTTTADAVFPGATTLAVTDTSIFSSSGGEVDCPSLGIRLNYTGRSTTSGAGNLTGVTAVTLGSFTIPATATVQLPSTNHAIQARAYISCTIKNCHITGCGGSGIYLQREYFVAGGGADEYSFSLSIENVEGIALGRYVVEHSGTYAQGVQMYNVEAQGCKLGGYYLSPTNVSMTACKASTCNGPAVTLVRCANSVSVNYGADFMGCHFESNSFAGGYEVQADGITSLTWTGGSILAGKGAHVFGIGTRGTGDQIKSEMLGGSFTGKSSQVGQMIWVTGTDSVGFEHRNPSWQSFHNNPTNPYSLLSDGGTNHVITWPGQSTSAFMSSVIVAPLPIGALTSSSGLTIGTANHVRGVRVQVQRRGTIKGLSAFIATQSGNIQLGIADTSSPRNILYASSLTAMAAAGAYQTLGDPLIKASPGDELELLYSMDNTTGALRGNGLQTGNMTKLPSGFPNAVLGAAPWLTFDYGGSTNIPAAGGTISEGGFAVSSAVPDIICYIA